MSQLVAQYFFNPLFDKFITQYVEAYGSVCTFTRDVFKPTYEKQIKPSKDAPDKVMAMCQTDFEDKQRRLLLKQENDRLFTDKSIYSKAELIQRLELRKLWKYRKT